MDSNLFLISLPATIALLFKVGILFYTRFSSVHSHLARLYMYFLFALSIQNIAEISHFYTLSRGTLPHLEFTAYYAAVIVAVTLLLHMAMSVSFVDDHPPVKLALIGIYLYAVILEFLLLFTPWLIADIVRMAYTATRVPGPLYSLFELYAIAGLLSVIAILIYGVRRQDISLKKRKAALMLLAIVPMALVIITVLALLHFNIRIINATIVSPIAITYFLVVTAYAIHNHRLFDIEFFIPWSKIRQRKTAFYDRIRATVAEIADLGSVNQVVNRLADLLRCPVALIGGPRPVLVMAGEAFGMARFPHEALQKIEHIVVANEIAEAMPETHALMTRHKVAAIVPFHPHSQTAASWMLLGEHFSEQVYTPLDFKMVEQLFDRMAELFLDKLLLMRMQLAEVQREMRALQQRLAISWETQEELRKENQTLREQNAQLLSEHVNAEQSAVLTPAGDKAGSKKVVELFAPGEKALEEHVAEFEARIIKQVLKRCGGNQSKAARLLGLRPNTLFYKIERYGLSDKNDRD